MAKLSGPVRLRAVSDPPGKPLWTIVLAVAAIGATVYSFTGGILSSHTTVALPSRFEVLVAAFPPLAFLILVARRSSFEWVAWALCLVAGTWLVARPIQDVRPLEWAYLLDHVVPNLSLALVFGRSLRAGHDPYCSHIAAKLHGSLSPLLARYTRGVTVAWTMFFCMVALSSIVLFSTARFNIWTRFAWLSTLPLLVLMFVIEYVCRFYFLPARERSGPVEVIRTLLRHL